MVIFNKKWKKYNEIQLTKNKMDLNIRKMPNQPPSPNKIPENEQSIYHTIFLHAIFNLHHEFLYAGTICICIPVSMISIPTRSWKMNCKFMIPVFFILMIYLTWVSSFYLQKRSVYLLAWPLYLQVRCMGLTTMKPRKLKDNL